jgi:hypothetical protein
MCFSYKINCYTGVKLLFYGKRGVALWLSWVLMVAFLVALSVFMFRWTSNYTQYHVNTLEQISDTSECDTVGISVDSVCQNTQVLNINLTNRNNLKIDQVVINIYDIYMETVQTKTKNITLSPGKSESIQMIKQGTTRQVEITPVFFTDTNVVHCNQKTALSDQISFC